MTLPVRLRDFSAALLVLAISIGFLLWASTYRGGAGTVPVLVAWGTIVLALIDLLSHLETRFGRQLRRLVTAERIVEWKMDSGEDISLQRILLSIGWLLGYLAALYFIGFIIATPIYILLYMIIHGGRSIRDSVLAAASVTAAIWLIFVVLFKYPLFPGTLFGGY